MLLNTLGAAELRVLAATWRKLAAEADDRAEQLDTWKQNRAAAEALMVRLAALPELVAVEIGRAGVPWDQAARVIAEREAVPVETVAHYWRTWCRSRSAEAMTARKLVIVRRALAGRRNAEIAAELGVSLRTVERALAGQKWGRPPPAAAQAFSETQQNRAQEVSRPRCETSESSAPACLSRETNKPPVFVSRRQTAPGRPPARKSQGAEPSQAPPPLKRASGLR